jgi:hypothetical protein
MTPRNALIAAPRNRRRADIVAASDRLALLVRRKFRLRPNFTPFAFATTPGRQTLGLVFALSAAAWGEVVLGEQGEIITQNFDSYPVMRMRSVPSIEVHIIESSEPPTGVGEASVPSAAPALANAIAALTGTQVRQLPLRNSVTIA